MGIAVQNNLNDFVERKNIPNVGENLSFAASESYKRLRTNVFFSLNDKENGDGYAIGVTSSVRGEGKSTTSLNTAYALAETGKKVILLECDMRLPVLAKKIGIEAEPGLSDFIVGLCKSEGAIKKSLIHENLDVIPAGSIPPNPSELLGTKRFKNIIKVFSKAYDFVVVDLPPVSSVSDALVVASDIDGMIVVVRQNLCSQSILSDTMRQLSVISDKILGFVFNGATSEGRNYSKKYYKYGYEYGNTRNSKRKNNRLKKHSHS